MMKKLIPWLLLPVVLVLGFGAGVVAYKDQWPVFEAARSVFWRFTGTESGARFRRAHTDASGVRIVEQPPSAAGPTQDQIRALEALGYASGTQQATGESGVKADTDTSLPTGPLLLTNGHAPEAQLMDIHGQVLHTWAKPFDDAFPDNTVDDATDGIGYFRRAALLADGALLAIYEGQGLIKLDARSNLVWAYPGRAHHDLQVMDDGSIYTLTRVAHVVPEVNATEPILEDSVTHLDANGAVLDSFSVLGAVSDSPYRSLLQASEMQGDIFHTNSLRVLEGRLADRNPAFRAGNFLLSLLKVHALVVIDAQTQRAVWAVAGLTNMQHDPTVLDDENILVFDNKGDRGMSRVVEIDIGTLGIAWEYSGQQHDLFSATCGTAQRLASGNTLITESDRGRALIVTPDGHTLWEYVTPHRTGPDGQLIATLFQAQSLPADTDLGWIPKPL